MKSNLLIIPCLLLVSCSCMAQIMPSAHRADAYKGLSTSLSKTELLSPEERMLPTPVTPPMVIVPPATMNIFNPFLKTIAVTLVYGNVAESISVPPLNKLRLTKNENCKSIITYGGDRPAFCTADLIKNKNYDLYWDAVKKCYCLQASTRIKVAQ